ncbi:Holliday junction branch migration protein RuvA [Apilactobacillus apisilvae]|uniref:Holliday junction branch migration complex subunit RuvA n=1 Tax=Apilactobacillus apisilvae TaxID=2923364 RepID=A0ABY4PIA0_9LACO|nr:Holliday junction branch migration protein RuvA [Apilactobacillus apisilvae]UQS85191.1 Holliday junction branch migration protein RuvA [Apilactobacillus apisilvae]
MYEYLNGLIVDINPGYIVIDVSGVGYLVHTADPYRFDVDDQKNVKVYIYQAISDSAQTLYGFYTREDKSIFEKLLSVSGIGPKNALAILAGNDPKSLLNAINNENVTYLTKFPGVGKKTAKQIILDLKGKIDDLAPSIFDDFNDEISEQVVDNTENQEMTDTLQALEALGYTKRDVEKVKKELSKHDKMTTDEYLSQGLKLLTQY